MNIKYIKVQHLYCRVPFRACKIQFVIKKRGKRAESKSEIELQSKPIDHRTCENMQLTYANRHIDQLALFVIAINQENRVVNIGSVDLNLADNFSEKKAYLKWVLGQNGYVVFSMRNEPFEEMSHLVNIQMSSNQGSSRSGSRKLSKIVDVPLDLKIEKVHIKKSDKSGNIQKANELSLQQESPHIIELQDEKNEGSQIHSINIQNDNQIIISDINRCNERLEDQNCKMQYNKYWEVSSNNPKNEIAQLAPQSIDIAEKLSNIKEHHQVKQPINQLNEYFEVPVKIQKRNKAIQQISRPNSPSNLQIQQLIIELLSHKLKNSDYMKQLKEYEIFQLTHRARMKNYCTNFK